MKKINWKEVSIATGAVLMTTMVIYVVFQKELGSIYQVPIVTTLSPNTQTKDVLGEKTKEDLAYEEEQRKLNDFLNQTPPLQKDVIKENCSPISKDTAISNVSKLPEVKANLENVVIKDDIKYFTKLEVSGESDNNYIIWEHHAEEALRELTKEEDGTYMMLTWNSYVVNKCTGEPITSRWLYDKEGNSISHIENPGFHPYPYDKPYIRTILW